MCLLGVLYRFSVIQQVSVRFLRQGGPKYLLTCRKHRKHEQAMEVAKMLVLAKSDINQVCRASGLFYGLELLNRPLA